MSIERGLAVVERAFLKEIGCPEDFRPSTIRSRSDVEEALDNMMAYYEELALRAVLAEAKALNALDLLEPMLVRAWARHPSPTTLMPLRCASTTLRHHFVEFSVQRLACRTPLRAVWAC
jgi:hypothetical protein